MPLLTLAETAHELRVSIRTIEREISDGRLVVTRIRSRPLIDRSDLQAYLARQKVHGDPARIPLPAGTSGPSISRATASESRQRLERLVEGRQRLPNRDRLSVPSSST